MFKLDVREYCMGVRFMGMDAPEGVARRMLEEAEEGTRRLSEMIAHIPDEEVAKNIREDRMR